ncbi:MAG: hypothetical protein CSA34_00710 [Desulfobulbus propionicus]|nr:MAG: hypothetical protein CSA34_00710 [Desulfobulbus propionicus]
MTTNVQKDACGLTTPRMPTDGVEATFALNDGLYCFVSCPFQLLSRECDLELNILSSFWGTTAFKCDLTITAKNSITV